MLHYRSLKRIWTSVRARRSACALGPFVLAALLGCGSGGSGSSGPACDPCDGGGALVTVPLNPDGIPYPDPATGYGRSSRSGTTPGSVMPNYRFLGYPNSDTSMGLQTVAFANFYDPCMKRYKLLHVTVASVWCVPCNEETAALVAGAAQLSTPGAVVAVFQVLDDGPIMGTPATQADLDYWITLHATTFTEALDPMLTNLGSLVDAATVPWNCDLDPRTMEILDQSSGWTGDITSELAPGFAALPATPSYPIPAACN
jgi:hypothetical protein